MQRKLSWTVHVILHVIQTWQGPSAVIWRSSRHLERCCVRWNKKIKSRGDLRIMVWQSAGRLSFFHLHDRDHRCCAITPTLVFRTLFCGKKRSSFNHYRSAPKRKDELMWCTCCLLYSRCDQRQLDANYRMPMSIGSFSYTQSG